MAPASPASSDSPSSGGAGAPYRRDPLSPGVKFGLLALVVFFHVGCGWALTQIDAPRIVVGDAPPMEVRMVAAESPLPEPQIDVPPPEDTPPPDLKPELDSMIQPPPPDLPPPVFPVQAPPPKPKPPAPKPRPTRPRHPPQAAAPAPHVPQPAAPVQPATPRTVAASQVSFLVRPNPVYPARARRANEQGVATVRVLIDAAGRPSQVSLQASSGHPSLDESAVSAVRAAQFRPYVEGGVPQPVWVLVPIKFVLQ